VRRFGGRAVLLGIVAVAVGGCLPSTGTDQARSMAQLWQVFLWAGAAVGLLVWLLATWALLRYRRKPGSDELPPQTHGSLPIEIAWTAIPLLVVLGLFALTLRNLDTVLAVDPSPDAVTLDVTAFRWGWQFTYPDAGVVVTSQAGSTPEIVLPVDTTIHVRLSSLDVVHAFYVPTFLFKRDAIPGRTSEFDLRIVAPGTYGGVCAEYCGVYHDAMPFQIRGVSPADYRAWLTSQAAGASVGASPAPVASP
jgi:cytochrome c oxidase subunit 2